MFVVIFNVNNIMNVMKSVPITEIMLKMSLNTIETENHRTQ